MKYAITRKLNLGRFGFQYETIDISVSDCDSWEQAEKEIQIEKERIINLFTEPFTS